MSTDPYSVERRPLSNLLSMLKSRTLVPAPCARDFVWNAKQVCRLLDSIYQRHPIGPIVLLNIKASDSSTCADTTVTELLIDGK